MKTGLLLVPVALALLAASSSPGSAASCRAAADADPQVAPDGGYVLFRRITRGCAPGASVWLSDPAGHNLRQLVGPATGIGRVSWRRDGLVSVTVRSQTLLLSPRGLVRRRLQVADPFWAPDAVQAAYAANGEIFLWPGDVMLPGRDNRIASSDPWAPRSDRIAYVHVGFPTSQVVVIGADGTAATTLYTDRVVDGPAWSPDGTTIAFAAGRPPLHLFVSRADSTDDLGQVGPAFAWMGHPSWSPDGRWIAFAGRRAGGDAVYVVRPDGTGLRRIATRPAAPDESVSWDPHAKGVAYAGWTRTCRRVGIFFAAVDGHGSQRLTNRCR